jgi:proteasome lid subunit RPN8/RPN11
MLRLTLEQRRRIEEHARRELPNECCGILLGTRTADTKTVSEVLVCRNAASNPRTRYEIAPKELVAAQKEARSTGVEIIGFYHSHPNGPAEPSQTDLREAYWVGCSYAILALNSGAAIRSFVLMEAGPQREFVEELLAADQRQ